MSWRRSGTSAAFDQARVRNRINAASCTRISRLNQLSSESPVIGLRLPPLHPSCIAEIGTAHERDTFSPFPWRSRAQLQSAPASTRRDDEGRKSLVFWASAFQELD